MGKYPGNGEGSRGWKRIREMGNDPGYTVRKDPGNMEGSGKGGRIQEMEKDRRNGEGSGKWGG